MKNHNHWNPKKVDISEYQQLDHKDVRWTYVSDYYDGPLSGRVNVGGAELWAEVFEECDETEEDLDPDTMEISYHEVCGFYRRYVLYKLSPESDAEEKRRHAIFEEHVGTHWSYNEDGTREAGELKPQSEHHKYYDQQKNWPEWKPEGVIVGWYQR